MGNARAQNQIGAVSDADVFTALVLARIAWDTGDLTQAMIHYRGCLTMLEILADNPQTRQPSSWLLVFGPYIHDILNFYYRLAIAGGTNLTRDLSPPRVPTTFRQRVKYFNELCRVGASSGVWISGIIETVHDYLDDVFLLLITRMLEVVRKENLNDKEYDFSTPHLLRHVLAELGDTDFNRGLGAMNYPDREGNKKLATCQLQLVDMAIRTLTDSVLLDGLAIVKVVSLASTVISYCQSHFPRKIAIRSDARDYYEPAYISFAGLALHSEQFSGRNPPFNQVLSSHTVGSWLIERLEEIRCMAVSRRLKTFWQSRSNLAMLQVLEEAILAGGVTRTCRTHRPLDLTEA